MKTAVPEHHSGCDRHRQSVPLNLKDSQTKASIATKMILMAIPILKALLSLYHYYENDCVPLVFILHLK